MVKPNRAVIPVWTTVLTVNVQLTLAHCCLSASKTDTNLTGHTHVKIHFVRFSNTHTVFLVMSRCPADWTGYQCEVVLENASRSSGSKSYSSRHRVLLIHKHTLWSCMFIVSVLLTGTASIVIPVLLLLLLALLVVSAILWYKRRMHG